MLITRILVGAGVATLFFIESSIAQEVFVPNLEPTPIPGVAGNAPSVLSMGGVSSLLPDGISPKKAEAVLSRIPATERRTRGVHDIALFRLLSPSVALVVTNERMQGTVDRNATRERERVAEKAGEGGLRHLARGHGKFLVFDLAPADNVPHTHIVGRIEKRHVGALAAAPLEVDKRSLRN
jgi:hypothetical protein